MLSSRLCLLCIALPFATLAQPPATRTGQLRPNYGSYDWVDPDKVPAENTAYKTFQSNTIHGDVSYLIYLPPDYEGQTGTRYPVLYDLPASGQTPKSGAEVVRRVNESIRAARIGPM